MKNIVLIISILISSISFAYAGDGYRFNLVLISNTGETIHGYYYHYTYDSFDKSIHRGNQFKTFIKKENIEVYTYINSINLENTTIDFTTNAFKKTVNLNNIDRIFIGDYLDFSPQDRLIELSEEEFKIVELRNPDSALIYNMEVAENCSYVLLTWQSKSKLSNHKKEIYQKYLELITMSNEEKSVFWNYIKLKKHQLLKENILLIKPCVPL
jgi:hypothetical protein